MRLVCNALYAFFWIICVFRWNQLDIAIVALSIMGITLEELKMNAALPINPTIIRIMRVLRIARGTHTLTHTHLPVESCFILCITTQHTLSPGLWVITTASNITQTVNHFLLTYFLHVYSCNFSFKSHMAGPPPPACRYKYKSKCLPTEQYCSSIVLCHCKSCSK